MTDTDVEQEKCKQHFSLGFALLLLLTTAYGVILFRSAWLCDDAFITFRVVDNFIHGHGLRWNITERVQAYTHPLWMFVASFFCFISREFNATPLALNILLSLAAVLLLGLGIARTWLGAVFALLVLTLSRAFVDYSTSGLENPLTHVFLALFFVVYFRENRGPGKIFWLSLLAAFGMTNRMDAALLFLPALLHSFWQGHSRKSLVMLIAGFSPFILWEAFSMIYYGFPFPNPYYAKLGTGIPVREAMIQGGYYFLDSLYRDPMTLCVCVFGLLIPFALRQWKDAAIAAGAILYLLYIVKIGGDYMSGRFFTGPLFCAVIILSRFQAAGRGARWIPAFAAVVLLAFATPCPTLTCGKHCSHKKAKNVSMHGITDNRRFSNWVGRFVSTTTPSHPLPETSPGAARLPVEWVICAGHTPFQSGPGVHYVDILGLTDPLLARLPAREGSETLVAHNRRTIPEGYFETLCAGENQFTDEKIGVFYEHLRVITQAPLFSWVRWKTIVRMNMGRYNSLIDFDIYRYFSDSAIPESPCPP